MTDHTARIRELNDRFRKGDIAVPGKTMMTIGVQALIDGDPLKAMALLAAIRDFDAFDAGNDPYDEHDFGAFQFDGEKLFWKLDYYAPDLEHGSQDPSDPELTVRVMTIMLAQEY